MEPSDWLSCAAVLIALVGTMVANRNAKSAKESAVSAKAQAETAEGQLKVMQEQWNAQQAATTLAAQPRLRLTVHEVFAPTLLKYGSYLEAQNQGQQPIHIDHILLNGGALNFLQLEWNLVTLPKLATLRPTEQTMLLFGLDNQIPFRSMRLAQFTGWLPLSIHFTHGADAKKWVYECQLAYEDTGELKTRGETLREG